MKKILLLGGSAQQVVAIEKAKELGYYTVLCDYLTDNPGQHHADKFYLLSTTDKEAVLEIAKKEAIDGIVAYASDPAAPTAAYVSEQLGLSTNPYQSVETLCNKDKFRKFLLDNGFNSPKANGYTSVEAALNDITKYQLPIIIKPVDSSGSKGVTVVRTLDNVEVAINFAFKFSRGKRIVVEEFIEKKHPYLVGGDIFVKDGQVILWGLLNCHRDNNVNSLVPVGKSYPLTLTEENINNIKTTLQLIVDKLEFKTGAMNIELIVDKNNRVFPIDIGPRNGGNMIPELLANIFNVDVVEMTIQSAMGNDFTVLMNNDKGYYATYNLHSSKDGIFNQIQYHESLKPFIMRECIYKEPGAQVEFFDNAAKALGILFLKFDTKEQMDQYMGNMETYIDVILD